MSKDLIEAIYPLSPMQQGMLFHTLYAPESGIYFQQVSCTLHGDLDSGILRQAWQHVIDHHPALRTVFKWDRQDQPLQIVLKSVTARWELLDWRDLSPADQEEKLPRYLAADRANGFDLSQAPLMRFSLIRLAGDIAHFTWSHHHILLDGWSLPLVYREVFFAYEALRAGREFRPEPARHRPFRDYITWLGQQDQAKAEAFWRAALAGVTAPTPFGIDRKPIAEERERLELKYKWSLSNETTGALESKARQHQVTLNTLVQSAWALVLSRYSGEENVVFGATVSGRPPGLAGVESMVGMFINTLPVRVRVAPDLTLASWWRALQADQVALREFEFSSLAQVQGWSSAPRGVALFESTVVFDNYPVDHALRQAQGSLVIRDIRSFEMANNPLSLVASPGSELALVIYYDSHRFSTDSIERLSGHVQNVLESFVVNPEQTISEINLLTEPERRQLLIEWNDTAVFYEENVCLPELIEAQAARTPNATALIFEDQKLTYSELNSRANQLAHHLRKLGVGPETLVGICVERSLDMVVGLLGILKAGGAYIPLDPTYPKERLAFMLEDANAPVLLTQSSLFASLPEHRAQVLCMDSDWPLITAESFQAPPALAGGSNLAYMIYTSGSTGRPKGVMNTHQAIVNRLLWMQDNYQLTPKDRVLQKTPFSFDVSVWEFFWPLLTGATLVIARPGGHQDSKYLIDLIDREQITTLHFVPSMLQVFLDHLASQPNTEQVPGGMLLALENHVLEPNANDGAKQGVAPGGMLLALEKHVLEPNTNDMADQGAAPGATSIALDGRVFSDPPPVLTEGLGEVPTPNPAPGAMPVQSYSRAVNERPHSPCASLRRIFCSGEALYVDLQNHCLAAIPAELHNLYGPTEAAVDVTFHACSPNSHLRSVPIGRPIANTQIYILDPQLQPVPIGVAGELHIGGVGLARGYWNRPDLTAEKFIPNPFSAEPGTRLYKTGDSARYVPGGSIEYLNRLDHQVKIRGFRIELGEIETALRQHPSVREAVVLAREDTPGDKRLVAYLVVAGQSAPSVGELRAALQRRLPEYMIPSFVILESLPLNSNGKVDRKALPAPDGARPEMTERPFVAPRSPLEEELAGILRELLHIERIGIYDNFFELGGHSLLLTQLASRIRQQFEVEVPLHVLFDAPSVVEMLQAIATRQIEEEDSEEVARLLEELQNLSPEEARALLENEGELAQQ